MKQSNMNWQHKFFHGFYFEHFVDWEHFLDVAEDQMREKNCAQKVIDEDGATP